MNALRLSGECTRVFSWQFHILLIKDFEENAVVKYKALPYNERNYSNFPIVKCMLLKGS